MIVIETWYCGCCGAVSGYGDRPSSWCSRCADHVLPAGRHRPLWERTWFAQTGQDCPFTAMDKH